MSKNTLSGAFLIFAALAVLAVVALAGPGGTQNTNSGGTQNTNTGGTESANTGGHAGHPTGRMTADAKFAMMAAMGGMAEVEMGRLAAQRGGSEDVRQYGQRMVDDHTRANEELMRVASAKGMTLPTAPDPKHRAEAQKLSALAGERFDREYVKMMIKDHKKTLSEFQKEAARGADAELKAFAAATLPALQEHLRMIQRISDKMALRRSGHLMNADSNAGGGNTNGNAGAGSNSNNSNR